MEQEIRTKPIFAGIVRRSAYRPRCEVLEYQPGNGSRYVVAITNLSHIGQDMKDALGRSNATRLYQISLLNGGSGRSTTIALEPDEALDFRDLATRLMTSVPDSIALAELLGYVLNVPLMPFPKDEPWTAFRTFTTSESDDESRRRPHARD